MESKCRQRLIDNVYNIGYATAANIAVGVGCNEAEANKVLTATASPQELLLLVMSTDVNSNKAIVNLSLWPSLKDCNSSKLSTVHVLAAVSHSFSKLYQNNPESVWTAISTKECAEMITNPTYGLQGSSATVDKIRLNMERRNERLQLSDDDLVRYSHELFYAVGRSDARPRPPAERDSCPPVVSLQPEDEPTLKKSALQGVTSTVVSSLMLDENGEIQTLYKEVPTLAKTTVDSAASRPTKKKQKPAGCDLMAFVKKRE